MNITLSIHNRNIQISWDSASLSENLSKLYMPWQVKPSEYPSEKSFKITVKEVSGGYHIKQNHLPVKVCSDELKLFSTMENCITLLGIDILKRYALFHASAIDLNGSGALIIGDHGSGKTTLALTAISSGFKALSDEVGVIMDDCCKIIGFPRPFCALKETTNLSPSVIPQKCTSLSISNEMTYIFFDEFYSHKSGLKYIFFPLRRPGETTLSEIGETEALRRILPLGFNLYLKPDGRFKDILRLIRNAPPFEIAFQDHWDAIRTIRNLL